jgi:hypothetical protein
MMQRPAVTSQWATTPRTVGACDRNLGTPSARLYFKQRVSVTDLRPDSDLESVHVVLLNAYPAHAIRPPSGGYAGGLLSVSISPRTA